MTGRQVSFFISLFHLFASLVPRSMHRFFVSTGNHLIFPVLKGYREIVKDNIRTIGRGKYTEEEVSRLAKRCFQNYSHKLLDYMTMHRLNSSNQGNWVEKEVGEENLKKALAKGRGVICVTPHLSHWELGGYVLASKGYPINILTLREESQYLSRYEKRLRKKAGMKTIIIDLKERPNFAILEIIKRLRGNEIVAMVADRTHEGEGIEVDFFGRPTFFPSGPAHLAFETGAAIVPVFVVLERKMKYWGIIQEPISMSKGGTKEEMIRKCLQEIATSFEKMISQYPDQWFNFFPYWKERTRHRV